MNFFPEFIQTGLQYNKTNSLRPIIREHISLITWVNDSIQLPRFVVATGHCFLDCFVFALQVMARRHDLLLHQEVKLRNKLVEYLTDWVLPSAEHHQSIPAELSVLAK